MSKKRIKAERVMHSLFSDKPGTPAYILPATATAYEQMVEQMAQAMLCGIGYEPMVRRALRAIGITAPKKGRT